MVFRRVFAKAFQAIERFVAFLDFVEDDQRFMGLDVLAASHRQVLQDAVYILCRFEELLVLPRFVEVEVCNVAVMPCPKLLEHPCFPNLPDAFEDQRLAVFRVFPCFQLVQH